MTDHWVYFGDGEGAEILDSREYIAKDGIHRVKFMLRPSERIEKRYKTKKDQDQNGAMVKDYPKTEVLFLERSVYRTRCWIFVDFEGNQTPASRRFEELTVALNDTERLIRSADAAKSRAYYELEMERQQKRMALRLQADQLREVARARGRTDIEDAMDSVDVDNPS